MLSAIDDKTPRLCFKSKAVDQLQQQDSIKGLPTTQCNKNELI